MKRYKQYMEDINVSDTLHERLMKLDVPPCQRAWRKYGTAAAVMLLIAGLGLWGVGELPNGQVKETLGAMYGEVETIQPDIALESPDSMAEQGNRALGSYEVVTGSVMSYYMLPYIDYGNMESSGIEGYLQADWDIPKGAVKKELSRSDIVRLLGGEEVLSTHLNWSGYELTGWAAWYENGEFWGAYIMGDAGPQEHFELAVTIGDIPPTCIAYLNSVEQDIGGVTVTASGHDSTAGEQGGVDASSRQVSFMKDGIGYRFDLAGASRALTEERVSRFVRQTVTDGLLDLSSLSQVRTEGVSEGSLLGGASYSVGEPNWED